MREYTATDVRQVQEKWFKEIREIEEKHMGPIRDELYKKMLEIAYEQV